MAFRGGHGRARLCSSHISISRVSHISISRVSRDSVSRISVSRDSVSRISVSRDSVRDHACLGGFKLRVSVPRALLFAAGACA
jgi:hypothetical protein